MTDDAKGKATHVGGKIKEKTGELLGDRGMEREGQLEQQEGQAKQDANRAEKEAREARERETDAKIRQRD